MEIIAPGTLGQEIILHIEEVEVLPVVGLVFIQVKMADVRGQQVPMVG